MNDPKVPYGFLASAPSALLGDPQCGHFIFALCSAISLRNAAKVLPQSLHVTSFFGCSGIPVYIAKQQGMQNLKFTELQ